MSTEKTVTWSGTVSLPDGDTIGLVVSGPATTPEEGLDIAAYAAGQLLGLAKQADFRAGGRIRQYVYRVFGVREKDLPGAPVETPSLPVDPIAAVKQDAAAAQAEEVLATEKRVAEAIGRSHPDAKPEQAKAPAPEPAPSAPPTPEASVSGAPQSGEVCVNCGAAVSASQAKLSQLFQSKTLCKSCMEATA